MPQLHICNACLGLFDTLTNGRCGPCETAERQKLGMTSNWSKISKRFRKLNPNCNDCGTTENSTVHHIDGRAAGNGYENLMTLCRSCHSIREAEIQRAKRTG